MITATDAANTVLLKHGCPLHRELAWSIARQVYMYTGYRPSFYKALSRLVKRGTIRRVRPGVYSAFGPSRD